MKVVKMILLLSNLYTTRCKMEAFVVDGTKASIRKFPHAAYMSLQCNEFDNVQTYMCGSSILNQELTLTAAHCTDGCFGELSLTVAVGHSDKRKGTVSTVLSFFMHEWFNSFSMSFDICLLKLKTPLVLNSNVKRVALMRHPPYNEEAEIAGWGFTDEKKRTNTHRLLSIKQYVMDSEDCHGILNKRGPRHKGILCVKSKDSSHTAKGDSGSALVVRGYIQIGIVSYKLKKTTKNTENMVVYTDTGYFYEWIEEKAQELMCLTDEFFI